MIYVEKLLFELRRGDRPDEFDDLDPNLEKEEIEKINERFDIIKKIINVMYNTTVNFMMHNIK